MTKLHFAQLSDIHISAVGDHHELLSGRSAGFLADIVTQLNRIDSLAFVLITGDLFDFANEAELEQFQEIIRSLQKPYYVIPGNHDRRPPGSSEGLTRHQFAHLFNPQIAVRPAEPDRQAGYWSIEVDPQIQLIGLDSIRDQDWGGIIDAVQMDWLKAELERCRNKLVMVAVHHPLHSLAAIDHHPDWGNFVCANGQEVIALLDGAPQVKVVLTGHHHLNRVDTLGQRLHLACPAIATYPCAYRTFTLTPEPGDRWRLEWQTHPAAGQATIAEAREIMLRAWQGAGFEADFVEAYARLSLGGEYDQNGSAVLG
jgi:3',5'-cyclic AMP phosphodiesterase CpdA